jgi:hypothetical protein
VFIVFVPWTLTSRSGISRSNASVQAGSLSEIGPKSARRHLKWHLQWPKTHMEGFAKRRKHKEKFCHSSWKPWGLILSFLMKTMRIAFVIPHEKHEDWNCCRFRGKSLCESCMNARKRAKMSWRLLHGLPASFLVPTLSWTRRISKSNASQAGSRSEICLKSVCPRLNWRFPWSQNPI